MEQTQVNDGFRVEVCEGGTRYVFTNDKKQTQLGKDFKHHLSWYPKARTQGARKHMEINDFDRQVWGRKMWLPRDVKKSHVEFGEIIQKLLNSLSKFVGGYSIIVSMPRNLKLTTARASNIGPKGFAGLIEMAPDRVNLPTVLHEVSHLMCYPHANHGNAFGAAYLLSMRMFGLPMRTVSNIMGRNSLCFWARDEEVNDRLRSAIGVDRDVIA